MEEFQKQVNKLMEGLSSGDFDSTLDEIAKSLGDPGSSRNKMEKQLFIFIDGGIDLKDFDFSELQNANAETLEKLVFRL